MKVAVLRKSKLPNKGFSEEEVQQRNMFCNLNKIILSFGQIQGFVAEEVGRECTCAHPGEGEPTGGELDTALETALEPALETALEIALESALEIALEIACLLGV